MMTTSKALAVYFFELLRRLKQRLMLEGWPYELASLLGSCLRPTPKEA
jgi:hypothetical protein